MSGLREKLISSLAMRAYLDSDLRSAISIDPGKFANEYGIKMEAVVEIGKIKTSDLMDFERQVSSILNSSPEL